jgi:hypothetical protein
MRCRFRWAPQSDGTSQGCSAENLVVLASISARRRGPITLIMDSNPDLTVLLSLADLGRSGAKTFAVWGEAQSRSSDDRGAFT